MGTTTASRTFPEPGARQQAECFMCGTSCNGTAQPPLGWAVPSLPLGEAWRLATQLGREATPGLTPEPAPSHSAAAAAVPKPAEGGENLGQNPAAGTETSLTHRLDTSGKLTTCSTEAPFRRMMASVKSGLSAKIEIAGGGTGRQPQLWPQAALWSPSIRGQRPSQPPALAKPSPHHLAHPPYRSLCGVLQP